MIDSPRNPGKAGEPPNTGAVRSPGRRRLLQAGISATPVVMTVVSRPVLAAQCNSPSAFFSGNESNVGGGALSCFGRTPGYWKQPQHFAEWPSGSYPIDVTGPPPHADTKFLDVFPTGPLYHDSFLGLTLLCVLEPLCSGGGPPFDVARHIVAALLNNLAVPKLVPDTVLSAAMIQAIWRSYSTTDSYSPGTGPGWNHTQIVNYLITTMPL